MCCMPLITRGFATYGGLMRGGVCTMVKTTHIVTFLNAHGWHIRKRMKDGSVHRIVRTALKRVFMPVLPSRSADIMMERIFYHDGNFFSS